MVVGIPEETGRGSKTQGLLPMNPNNGNSELEKPGSTLKALRISERALSHDSDEKDFQSKLSSSEAVQLAHDLLLELPAEEREGGLSDRDLKDEEVRGGRSDDPCSSSTSTSDQDLLESQECCIEGLRVHVTLTAFNESRRGS